MHFAQKLQQVRKEKGMSQLELAKKMGVSNTHISKWEASKGHPSLTVFGKLVQALEVSADFLLFDNVPPEGCTAIDDFDLYEAFRKTEGLPAEDKQTIKNVVDAVVLRQKINEMPETKKAGKSREAVPTLRKVAGRR